VLQNAKIHTCVLDSSRLIITAGTNWPVALTAHIGLYDSYGTAPRSPVVILLSCRTPFHISRNFCVRLIDSIERHFSGHCSVVAIEVTFVIDNYLDTD
jgi:hypothetical protein